jgi:tRNA nucleotidyltransferase (CCA-adding enzyme)
MSRTIMESGWTHFAHDADMGIAGTGDSLAAAFEQAALALTAVITDPEAVAAREAVDIACSAPDRELLLYEWLNALVYEMAVRGMLFGRFAVEISENELTARAWGEAVDRARHAPSAEVKGATMTALSVRKDADGRWVASCVVDV